MSRSIVTPVGRASFPHLDKPNTFNKYALSLLLPKNDPKVKEFAVWLRDAVTKEAVNVAGQDGLKTALQYFTSFKDGDNVQSFNTYRAEYAGHYVLNLNRAAELGKPCIVNRNKQPISGVDVYPGCNVVAYIDVFGYKYGPKKSVSVGFQHVMKVGDNESFAGSGISADIAFADLDIPEIEGSDWTETEISDVTEQLSGIKPTGPVSSQQDNSNPFMGV